MCGRFDTSHLTWARAVDVHHGDNAGGEGLVPTVHDALWLWGLSGFVATYLGACIAFGRAPGKGRWIKRNDMPGAFWGGMCIGGVGLFVLVFLSLYASIPDLPA
jgi:hypothetical protein